MSLERAVRAKVRDFNLNCDTNQSWIPFDSLYYLLNGWLDQ